MKTICSHWFGEKVSACLKFDHPLFSCLFSEKEVSLLVQ
jgi:hypothetical protein